MMCELFHLPCDFCWRRRGVRDLSGCCVCHTTRTTAEPQQQQKRVPQHAPCSRKPPPHRPCVLRRRARPALTNAGTAIAAAGGARALAHHGKNAKPRAVQLTCASALAPAAQVARRLWLCPYYLSLAGLCCVEKCCARPSTNRAHDQLAAWAHNRGSHCSPLIRVWIYVRRGRECNCRGSVEKEPAWQAPQ